MRRSALETHVRELIENTFTGDDADVATTLLTEAGDPDSGFGALCTLLDQHADGDRDQITSLFTKLANNVPDWALDKIAKVDFDSSCGWLASRVGDE